MKLLLKNTEKYEKSSQNAEVLNDVTFTISERIISENKRFIVTVCTQSDIDSRVRYHWEHRYVEEKKLNSDFSKLIDLYDKSINLSKTNMPLKSTYDPKTSEQFAIIGAFDSKIDAMNYIEGIWSYILSLF